MNSFIRMKKFCFIKEISRKFRLNYFFDFLYLSRAALLIILLFIFVFLIKTEAAAKNNQEEKKYEINEVDFLRDAPDIDGVLDKILINLPVREFGVNEKSDEENQLTNVTFRLAYGVDFLYLYIEVAADTFICRDRGYQNGDGFHLVIAKPMPDNSPAREFYVLAFSPQSQRNKTWQRKFIWYRNVDLAFRQLKQTRFAVKLLDGKVGYEVLIPWSEIYPFHPWHSASIGFNLCYVQAVGKNDKNYYYILKDNRMQSEQSPRRYVRLNFSLPEKVSGTAFYSILNQNHCRQGEDIFIKTAGIADKDKRISVFSRILTGESEVVLKTRHVLEAGKKLTKKDFKIPTSKLIPGGYRLNLSSPATGFSQTINFTILPDFEVTSLRRRLKEVRGKISAGSYTTLLFSLQEIAKRMAQLKEYDTAGKLRIAITRLLSLIEKAESETDAIAEKRGVFRRAYRSRIDSTLQPYSVKIPRDFNPKKRYPLLVFLHGSGVDDRQVLSERKEEPVKNFIELAPFGRGTSNVFSADHAQDDIREAIDDVIANYPIDTTKIILAGFSMGGYGVYRTFYEMPHRFRALAVFSGHPDLANKWGIPGKHPNFLEKKYLEPFKNMPIFIFHGGQDRNCPVELTRNLVALLKECGARVTFCFEENKGHENPGLDVYQRYWKWLKEVALAK